MNYMESDKKEKQSLKKHTEVEAKVKDDDLDEKFAIVSNNQEQAATYINVCNCYDSNEIYVISMMNGKSFENDNNADLGSSN